MKIVIPGGSGQVGQILARHFHSRGHTITVLSRNPHPSAWRVVSWDGVTPGAWITDLAESDVCINLAGRSVDCRYNPTNRRAIYDSRIRSTCLLNQVIASLNPAPRLWINASTATIYRHALDRAMTEADGELGGNESGTPSTWDFSIDVAKGWEEAFLSVPTPRTRKIATRSAMTLSPDRGGVFDRLLALVRLDLGGSQGAGTQFVSWIHEADFARAIDLLIAREDFLRRGQSRFAKSLAESRLHAHPARCMGHPLWIVEPGVAHRNRRLFHANRIGTHSQKQARRAGPSAKRWFPVPFSRVAIRGQRLSCPVAPESTVNPPLARG